MFTTQPICEELYEVRNEAIISASLYAFEALSYMKHHVVREEEKINILAFNDFVISLANIDFTQLKYCCEEIIDTGGFRVKLSVMVDGCWQSASYNCHALPEGKFTLH